MALGFKSTVADALLNSLFRSAAFSIGTSTQYVQLHTAAPGSAGTTSVADGGVRQSVTWGASSGGAVTSATASTWTSVTDSSPTTYTHASLWDASSSGNFLMSGTVSASSVNNGDTFTVPIGNATVSLSVAS